MKELAPSTHNIKAIEYKKSRSTKAEKQLFGKLEKNYDEFKADLENQESIIHDIGDSTSERVP
jgi:hypothetical protein